MKAVGVILAIVVAAVGIYLLMSLFSKPANASTATDKYGSKRPASAPLGVDYTRPTATLANGTVFNTSQRTGIGHFTSSPQTVAPIVKPTPAANWGGTAPASKALSIAGRRW